MEFPEKYVRVLYNFSYSTHDGRKINMVKDEEFLLLQKTNRDWWKVIRGGERRAFYAPASYLEEVSARTVVNSSEISAEDVSGSRESNADELPPDGAAFRRRSNSADVKVFSDRCKARSLEFLSSRIDNAALQSCENLNTLSSNGSGGKHRKIRLARDSWDRRKSWAMSLDETELCENDLVSLSAVADPPANQKPSEKGLSKWIPTMHLPGSGPGSSSQVPPPLPPKTKTGSFRLANKSEPETCATQLRSKASPPVLPPRSETTRLHSIDAADPSVVGEETGSVVQNLRRNYENVDFYMRVKRNSGSSDILATATMNREQMSKDEWVDREKTSLGSFRSRLDSVEPADGLAEWRRKSRNSLESIPSQSIPEQWKTQSDSRMHGPGLATKPIAMAFTNPLYTSAPSRKPSPNSRNDPKLIKSGSYSHGLPREDSNVIKIEVASGLRTEFGSYKDSSSAASTPLDSPGSFPRSRPETPVYVNHPLPKSTASRSPPTPSVGDTPIRVVHGQWGEYLDSTGRKFYFNSLSKEATWKPPRKSLGSNGKLNMSNSCGSLDVDSSAENLSAGNLDDDENQYDPVFDQDPVLDADAFSENPAEVAWRRKLSGAGSRSGWNGAEPPDFVLDADADVKPTPQRRTQFYRNRREPIYANDRFDEALRDGGVEGEVGVGVEGRPWDFPITAGWARQYDGDADRPYFTHSQSDVRWASKSTDALAPHPSSAAAAAAAGVSLETLTVKELVTRRESKADNRAGKDFKSVFVTPSHAKERPVDVPEFWGSHGHGSLPNNWEGSLHIVRKDRFPQIKIVEIKKGGETKKTKKNVYAVLTDKVLAICKNQDDLKQFQWSYTLDLKGAEVERKLKGKKPGNSFQLLTVLQHRAVFTGDERLVDDWFRCVDEAVRRLSSGDGVFVSGTGSVQMPADGGGQSRLRAPASSMLLDPKEAKKAGKLGRNKSVKEGAVSNSIEDITVHSDKDKGNLRSKLQRFFHRRPTMESIKNSGIYKDEPVFGCSLASLCAVDGTRVPRFVQTVIEVIESKEENLKSDGLYRASGNLSQVQRIRCQADQDHFDVMRTEEDIHVLTGALKLFFRELKEPLIPHTMIDRLLAATNAARKEDGVRKFKSVLAELPDCNRDTLYFVLDHLKRVTQYCKQNRMDEANLAIVFGPTLMWPEMDSADMASDMMKRNLIVQALLRDFHDVRG